MTDEPFLSGNVDPDKFESNYPDMTDAELYDLLGIQVGHARKKLQNGEKVSRVIFCLRAERREHEGSERFVEDVRHFVTSPEDCRILSRMLAEIADLVETRIERGV